MRKVIDPLLLLFVALMSQFSAYAQNASFVNPFIGTGKSHARTLWGNYGGTYPGAVAPWGQIQLTPETSVRPLETGYYYEDTKIRSFSCVSHASGYPNGSAGLVHLSFFAGVIDRIPSGYDGRPFSHRHEEAKPGYYCVRFQSGDRAEMTAVERAGLFRYYSEEDKTTLVVTKAGTLSAEGRNVLKSTHLHTTLRFSRPWEECMLRHDTAYLVFDRRQTADGLLIKVGASTHSFEGSAKNMDAGIAGWDFDSTRQSAYDRWDRELACVRIESDDRENKEKFYTALYHSFLLPWVVSDVDGMYSARNRATEGEAYGEFSSWDTFRTLHPLLSLLKPQRQTDMVRSMMDEFRRSGKLPKGPMTGFHTIPILLDSYLKGATDEDASELYHAMLSCYEHDGKGSSSIDAYIDAGYLDASKEKSVSITTEYAYNDWAMGRFATLAGRPEEAETFLKRSYNYRNLFDEQTLFILPKDKNGFVHNSGELGYQESNRWTASYFVPHNVRDLFNLAGGAEAFVRHLQSGYEAGDIIHDNEPVFHYPYLFTWAGRPDLTAQAVRRILNNDYSSRPGGIPGNDDLGSTSSWFVLSAIGLFPACPGTGEYILTPPLFPKIELLLRNGKTLSISTRGDTGQYAVFPSLSFDGKAHHKLFVTHRDISNGGELIYDFNNPASDLSSYIRPYSETKEKPDFHVTASAPSLKQMHSGEPNNVAFTVANQGAKGTYIANLYDGTQLVASKRLLVEQGCTASDTISFTLYREGKHRVGLEDYQSDVQVDDSVSRTQVFICAEIEAASLFPVGDTVSWQFTCKNISGRTHEAVVPVYVNGQLLATPHVLLDSGMDTVVSLPFAVQQSGFLQIEVLGRRRLVKAYTHASETCLLHLDYNCKDSAMVYDRSGFGNHGQLHGGLRWDRLGRQGVVHTGEQAYIVFPRSASLQSGGNKSLTISTWLSPQSRPEGYADFFTKGDYTLFKMEGAHRLVFFAGGWGRGVCQIAVPDDWYTAWHHIAGVCTGSAIKLYLNGKLMQEIAVDGELSATDLPWNLGRNEEMPYSRFADMKFGGTRIYGAALSDSEVYELYEQECMDFK